MFETVRLAVVILDDMQLCGVVSRVRCTFLFFAPGADTSEVGVGLLRDGPV